MVDINGYPEAYWEFDREFHKIALAFNELTAKYNVTGSISVVKNPLGSGMIFGTNVTELVKNTFR